MADFLPYASQALDEADIAAVVEVLRGDYLTGGPTVAAFEDKLKDITGAKYAIAVSSGTAALHLCAMVAGVGPGDHVVVPANTFLATANAVRYVGGEVIFADVDADTGLMGADELRAALKAAEKKGVSVKGVFPVHFAGQPAAPEALHDVAKENGLTVVEDASHALGTLYGDGQYRVGQCAHGDMTVFSFHAIKTVAMGEGGAITTNDRDIADRLKLLRSHGMTRDPEQFVVPDQAFDENGAVNPWYYEMRDPGFNYRVSDIHCALGLSQLRKLDTMIDRRRDLVAAYDRALAPLAPTVQVLERVAGAQPGWHLYVALIDFDKIGKSRQVVMTELRTLGIGSQVTYIPVNRQPYYRERYGMLHLPGADRYYARALSLPLSAAMTERDVTRVVDALHQVLGGAAPA